MSALASDTAVLALLALELMPGNAPPHAVLSQQQTGQLVERIGHDLSLLAPAVSDLDLVIMGAHFDPAEILRPGWPIHRRLHELHQRAPGRNAAPRLIGFGADAHGEVPQPLQCDPELHGGALRLLPILLTGEGADRVVDVLESELMERGMARAETALLAQEAFASRLEHARYLTVHDLAAMMALQYQHMGLDALWPILETALLAPGRVAWLDAPPEPLIHLGATGEARIALFSPASWHRHYMPDETRENHLATLYGYFQARIRQLAAILQAHAIPVLYVDCPPGADARALLQQA